MMSVDPGVIRPLITARRVPLVRSFIYRRTCVNHSSICPWDGISLIYVDDPSSADALLAKDMGIATSWQKLEHSVMAKYPRGSSSLTDENNSPKKPFARTSRASAPRCTALKKDLLTS